MIPFSREDMEDAYRAGYMAGVLNAKYEDHRFGAGDEFRAWMFHKGYDNGA